MPSLISLASFSERIVSQSMPISAGYCVTTAIACVPLWVMLPEIPCGQSGSPLGPMAGTVRSFNACAAAMRPARWSALRLRPASASWA